MHGKEALDPLLSICAVDAWGKLGQLPFRTKEEIQNTCAASRRVNFIAFVHIPGVLFLTP